MSLIFFSTSMVSSNHTITVGSLAEVRAVAVQITAPFTLVDYTFSTDTALSRQEFDYLTDFKIGNQVSGDDMQRALSHLWYKNCFKLITCTIEDCDAMRKKIIVNLQGSWRFDKLKVVGLLVGKDWYKHHYLMEPGDVFDQDKHLHSIDTIKQACHKEGFFNISISSKFIKNERLKTVMVQLTIDKGARFSINQTSVVIEADEHHSSADLSYIKEQLDRNFIKSHRSVKYAKSVLEAQAVSIKQYLAHRGYLLATIDLQEKINRGSNSVSIEWQITLGKKRNFVFFGARFFAYNQMLERILAFGRSAWIVPASILADEINDMYEKKGFWDVGIEGTDEGDRAIFVITEGKRGVINEVVLRGLSAFDAPLLVKKFFKKVKQNKLFDHAALQECFDTLIDYYYANGYTQAKVVAHECERLKPGLYRLIVSLSEGSCNTAQELSIPGFTDLEGQGPFLQFQKKPKPVIIDSALLAEHKRWLSDCFNAKGLTQATFRYELFKSENGYVLIWHITPGNKVTFGKTIVQDTSGLSFGSVVRELCYKPYDRWDQDKLRQSFVRLKDRQLFDVISFVPLPLEADQAERPLLLKLHKDDPFEVRTRAGLALQHVRQYQTFGGLTYTVGGTFLVKNPTNHTDYFRFDADVARSTREVNMRYFYPWLFSKPVDGLFHAYAIKYDQPGFIGSNNDLYTIFQNGFSVGLQHKTSYLDAGVNIGFEMSRTKVGDDIKTKKQAEAFACAIEFNQRLLNKNIPFLFFEPTILIDRLDSNLNPTHGTFTLMSMKGMFPTVGQYVDSYFVKMLIEHSWFVPLATTVAAFRARFGHIFHRTFADIIPNERFYLGGSHSIRSYGPDLAPPLGCFVDDHGKKNIVPRGGKTMLNFNVELRLAPIKKVSVVLFNDAGLLCGDDFVDFSSSNVVAGTGFGFRYFTPIGPLRFDVAWKWKKRVPQECGFNWYLTFGQAF